MVYPVSTTKGQGSYVELFPIKMHFPLSSNQNGKGCFPDVSSEKIFSLLRFCIILGDKNIFINLYIFNFISNFLGKAELSMASCDL